MSDALATITRHGFGASMLGNLYRETTDDEAQGAVDAAWDAGVRYFDTAPYYGLGLSERRLGAALAARPRDEYVLSTKVGRVLVDNPDGAGQRDDGGFAVPATARREWDLTRDGVRRSLDASLERLGLDRIDVAYLHDPDDHEEQAMAEAIPALIELRDQGVVSAVGVGMNQAAMPARFIREFDLDLVMLAGRCTLLDRTGEQDLLPLAAQRGVKIIAAAVYNSGLLSTARPVPDATFNYAPAGGAVLDLVHALADVCERRGVELPAAAAQYPLRHDVVISAVFGERTAAEVESNEARLAVPIPDALWHEVDAMLVAHGAVVWPMRR